MEFLNILKDHYKWKHQIIKLSIADMKKTYSGAALGWFWALVKPSVMIFVYWFAFAVGLKVKLGTDDYPFFLWLLAGIIPWFFISDILTFGTECMRKYKYLITKMKFPISVIPTFVSVSKLSVHLFLLALVVIIFMLFGHFPDLYYLQIPFYMLLMVIMAIGYSLFASILAAISADFLNLVKSFTTALFWMSGIMWNPDNIDIPWLREILRYNPISYLAEGYRNCFVYKEWFFNDLSSLAIFLGEMIVLWILGVFVYTKLKKEIPDVL